MKVGTSQFYKIIVAAAALTLSASCSSASMHGKGRNDSRNGSSAKRTAPGSNELKANGSLDGKNSAGGSQVTSDGADGDGDIAGVTSDGAGGGIGDGSSAAVPLMKTDGDGAAQILTSDSGYINQPLGVTAPLVQGEQNVLADVCSGQFVGGYCSAPYVKIITFAKAFRTTPKVLVSGAIISNQGGDVGGATDRLVAFADQISATSFRMVCAGSPWSGPYEGWNSVGSCSWIAIGESDMGSALAIAAETKSKVLSNDCAAGTGGYCQTAYFKHVKFDRPFAAAPKVLVSAANISDQGGDVGGATDRYVAYAEDITEEGFKMVCSGSPVGPANGAYEGWNSIGTCGYLAIGERADGAAAVAVEGAQNITSNECDGQNYGGYCERGYLRQVKFENKYIAAPVVIVTAAVVSNQGGDIGGATDKVVAFADDVSAEGFRMSCSGSPKFGTNQYEGRYSVGACSYLVIGQATKK